MTPHLEVREPPDRRGATADAHDAPATRNAERRGLAARRERFDAERRRDRHAELMARTARVKFRGCAGYETFDVKTERVLTVAS